MKTNIAINRLATILLTIALLLTISGSHEELASEEDKPDETTSIADSFIKDITENPLALPDTSSPQAALKSFLDDVNSAYSVLMAAHRKNMKEPGLFTSESVQQMEKQAEKLLEKGVYCLNLSDVPDSSRQDAGYESTIKLKEILDRIKLPLSEDTLDAQSKETDEKQNKTPEKDKPDAQAIKIEEEQEKIPELEYWRLPETDIVISKVIKGPRKGEFLFTPQTVARIDRFYEKVKYLPYKTDALISIDFLDFYEGTPGRLLPPKWSRWIPVWSTAMYLNQTIWQWFALFVLPLATLSAIWTFYRLLKRKSAKRSSIKKSWESIIVVLVAAVAVVSVFYILDAYVNITGSMLTVCSITLYTIFWFLLSWAAFLIGTVVSKTIIASPKIDPNGIHASLIRASGSFIGIAIAAVLFLYGAFQPRPLLGAASYRVGRGRSRHLPGIEINP